MRVKARGWLWIGAGVLVAGTVAIAADEHARSVAAADEKRVVPGIENFGRLDARLFRGAQPEISAYPVLKTFGINAVVRFSTGGDYIEIERREVEKLGIHFVSLPWRADETPGADQIADFFEVMRAHPDWKIFVHCREGVDRTGVMVALYRIAVDHWSVDAAVNEMRAFHYHTIFQPHLQTFVEQFPAMLVHDPALRAHTPAPAGN